MIEAVVSDLRYEPSATPPFEIAEEAEVSEELRYTYRLRDLRRPANRERLACGTR